MSEYIRKFKPPSLSGSDKAAGVQFVETPPQRDFLDQELNVGDIVIYATGNGSYLTGKVIGFYTRLYPKGKPMVKTLAAIIYHYYNNNFTRQSMPPYCLIKLSPEQYGDRVKNNLLEA